MFFNTLVNKTEEAKQELFNQPVIQKTLAGEITLSRYQTFLTQAYHHVKHTVPLLMACGSRLPQSHNKLQLAIAEYIDEEIGHEQWILNDLKATGADPELIRNEKPSMATELMVAYAYHQIDRVNPLAFFGMVHVLEGTSIALATQTAGLVKNTLNLPESAFSYLNSHGSLDIEHVKFFESLMNNINCTEDQKVIIHSANMFYHLYGDVLSVVEGSS